MGSCSDYTVIPVASPEIGDRRAQWHTVITVASTHISDYGAGP